MPLVYFGLVSCGGNDLLLPSSGQPAQILVVSGNDQTDTVGHRLERPFVVAVTDPEDRPVEDVEVVFVLLAGAGIEPIDTVTTGSNGQATITYTLSTVSGAQIVEARVKPVVPSTSLTATFTATAMPEAAVGLVLAGGGSQRGEVATALAESLAVRAVDRFGNGVEGIEVSWDADGGSVSAALVTTGADGRSAVQRILGDRTGTYRTTAVAAGLDGSPITFTATAVPSQLFLITQPSATAQVGVPLVQQPELQLQDPFGTPLSQANVRVTVAIASGGGSLGGAAFAESDATGRVQFNDLSIRGEPGTRTLIFAADGFASVTSTDIVVAAGPPSPNQSSVSVPGGTAGTATPISIRLEDEFGNPVEGAAGSIAVSVSGANQLASLPVNEEGNGSYSASYTPIIAGPDQVDVLVNGLRLAGSPFSSNVVPGPASPATTTAQVIREGFFIYTITIVVTARDAQGNPLGHGGDQVQVLPSGGAVRDAQDQGDGTYVSAFGTFDPNHPSDIFLNGAPLAGNPYRP